MAATLEREVKLRFDDADAARAAVAATGAGPLRSRRLQADAVFDSDQAPLSPRGEVLRVRIDAGRSFLTFKSPAPHPTMKLREELETSVGDGSLLVAILERLGFHVTFRYEKYREEFQLDDVVIAVDETPVGTFVEIEGSDDGITRTARAMGRGPGDFVLDSYRALFVRACADRGITATHMLFPSD